MKYWLIDWVELSPVSKLLFPLDSNSLADVLVCWTIAEIKLILEKTNEKEFYECLVNSMEKTKFEWMPVIVTQIQEVFQNDEELFSFLNFLSETNNVLFYEYMLVYIERLEFVWLPNLLDYLEKIFKNEEQWLEFFHFLCFNIKKDEQILTKDIVWGAGYAYKLNGVVEKYLLRTEKLNKVRMYIWDKIDDDSKKQNLSETSYVEMFLNNWIEIIENEGDNSSIFRFYNEINDFNISWINVLLKEVKRQKEVIDFRLRCSYKESGRYELLENLERYLLSKKVIGILTEFFQKVLKNSNFENFPVIYKKIDLCNDIENIHLLNLIRNIIISKRLQLSNTEEDKLSILYDYVKLLDISDRRNNCSAEEEVLSILEKLREELWILDEILSPLGELSFEIDEVLWKEDSDSEEILRELESLEEYVLRSIENSWR